MSSLAVGVVVPRPSSPEKYPSPVLAWAKNLAEAVEVPPIIRSCQEAFLG